MRSAITRAMLLAVLLLGLAAPVHAATKVWFGVGGDSNWSNGGNWSPSGAPVTGDTVRFNGAITSNADLGSGVRIAAIVFAANAGNSTVNGAVTLDGNLATVNIDNQGSNSVINAAITITGATLYVRSSAGTLKLTGEMSGSFGVGIFGPGTVEFGGGFSNSYIGNTALASSANSFGGPARLNLSGLGVALVPGPLIIGEGTGSPNSVVVSLTAPLSQVIANTSPVTVASDGRLELNNLSETIGRLTGTGSVTMSGTGTLAVGDATNFSFGGIISGSGNFDKVSSGVMTLTAAQTFTGFTRVSEGTLVLGSPNGTQTIKGAVTIGDANGAAASAILKTNGNYRIASNTCNVIIRSDGQLDIGDFLEDVGTINVDRGQVAMLNAGRLRMFGDLSMSAGTISGGSLWLGGNVLVNSTPSAGAMISSTVDLGGSARTFTVNSGGVQPQLTVTSIRKDIVPLDASLTKAGAGTLRLSGSAANNYGGSTTIERGILELNKPGSVNAVTGPLVIGNDIDSPASATLRILTDSQFSSSVPADIRASGVLEMSGVQQAVSGLTGTGRLKLSSLAYFVSIVDNGTAEFAGTVEAVVGTHIYKAGVGEQTFSGPGTAHTGHVHVGAGRLTVNSLNQFGSTSDVENGGELGGVGRAGSFLISPGGRIRPGNGVGGTLTTGDITFASGSSLVIDLLADTVGSVGQLAVAGSVTLNSGAELKLQAAPSYLPPIGAAIPILINQSAGAVSGQFLNLPEGRVIPTVARNLALSYSGGTGNDVTITARPTIDIDGDGRYLANTDGALILRYLSNLTGLALTGSAIALANAPVRVADGDIFAYLGHINASLDVDSSGALNGNDALLVARWLFGFRGAALVASVPRPAQFATTAAFAQSVENAMALLAP